MRLGPRSHHYSHNLTLRPVSRAARHTLRQPANLPRGGGGKGAVLAWPRACKSFPPISRLVTMSSASASGHVDNSPSPSESVVIREGAAKIQFSTAHDVFYNPVQEVNRDLSCAVIRVLAEKMKVEEDANAAKEAEKARLRAERWAAKQTAAASAGDAARGSSSASEQPQTAPPRSSNLRVLEALSATGLRAIRYKREISAVKSVVANDLDPSAVETIRKNVEFNGLSPESDVIPNCGDAAIVMLQAKVDSDTVGLAGKGNMNWTGTYDVVDIDPYGGCHPFVEGAVQSVKDGGLLCVTSTDMAVLCGNHPEACMNKYGATSINGKNVHEMALRILLGTLERAANRFQRTIEPMLTLSIDFYARMFVRVYASPARAKDGGCKQGYVYMCSGCDSLSTQPMMRKKKSKRGGDKWQSSNNSAPTTCVHCEHGVIKMAGPMWLEPIHSPDFLDMLHSHLTDSSTTKRQDPDSGEEAPMYNQHRRVLALVSAARDELIDVPLFYTLPRLANVLRVSTPPLPAVHAALRALGREVSASHCDPQALKTTASTAEVWDVMRSWQMVSPSKRGTDAQNHSESPGFTILAKPPAVVSDFSEETLRRTKLEARKIRENSVPKWLPNPQPHWGPKPRAGTKKAEAFYDNHEVKPGKEGASARQRDNQGQRKRRRVANATPGDAEREAGDKDAAME